MSINKRSQVLSNLAWPMVGRAKAGMMKASRMKAGKTKVGMMKASRTKAMDNNLDLNPWLDLQPLA